MVIETTRENEILPGRASTLRREGALQQNIDKQNNERSKLRKTNPQVKIGSNPKETGGRMRPPISICLKQIHVKVLSCVQINYSNNEKATMLQILPTVW